ncbi:MAG TPA: Rossmann-like and DUF2520 domain-containing protein [Gemmatimonadales bacterium]|nr:Rossmann-like and DUF2520 domain-containing protein [Gemmatimonadales bacterium]
MPAARTRSSSAVPPLPAVGIVGPGRAGLGLALALRRARVKVAAVHGRHDRPMPAGLRLTTGPVPPWLSSVGVVVLAVRDDALDPLVRDLARSGGVGRGHVVLHLSGALTSAVLAPLAAAGAAAGSMHPLMTVSLEPAEAARHFRGASFVLEGDLEAVGIADALVRRLGGIPLTLAPEAKPRYHAGAVFASNYVVTMLAAALRLLEEAGMARDAALAALVPLARATLDSVAAAGPAGALTGPIARGDAGTLRRHLAAIPHREAELYRAVGRETLRLARQAGLDEAKAARLEEILRVQ